MWRDTGALRLEHGALVAGRVVAAGNASPIAGAEILAIPVGTQTGVISMAGERPFVAARTDADGRYRIPGAPFSTRSIVAMAQDAGQQPGLGDVAVPAHRVLGERERSPQIALAAT